MHARLAKLIDKVLPHKEVQQLSRLGHDHLALGHIVQGLIWMKTKGMGSTPHLFVIIVDDVACRNLSQVWVDAAIGQQEERVTGGVVF